MQQKTHSCSSAQPGMYNMQDNAYAYYPQYDQNLYQYGEGSGHPYQAGEMQAYAYPQEQPRTLSTWFDFSDSCYLKGFLIGAGVTFLLTNSTVQKAIVRGGVNLMSALQGGVEEVKEQVKDIKAEMSQGD